MSELRRIGRGPNGEYEFERPAADPLERFYVVSLADEDMLWEAAEALTLTLVADVEAMPMWRRPWHVGTVLNDGRTVEVVDDDARRLTLSDGTVLDEEQTASCLTVARLVAQGC